mmetsp:Transcript_32648/g.71632  ORF Transcript_32648/g.71632 Transcript_32648/m.71632 type:complete len:242 (+) Transcript_32648:222-947(+)
MTEKKAARSEKRRSLLLLLLALGGTELEGRPRLLLRKRQGRRLQEDPNSTMILPGEDGDDNITAPISNTSSNSSQPLSSPPTVSPTSPPSPPPCAVAGKEALQCGASPDSSSGRNGDGPVAEQCCADHSCMAGNTVCIVKIKAPIGGILKPDIVAGIGGSLTKPGREPPPPDGSAAAGNATTVGNATANATDANATLVVEVPGIGDLEEEIGNSGLTVGLAFALIVWGVVLGCVMRKLSWC